LKQATFEFSDRLLITNRSFENEFPADGCQGIFSAWWRTMFCAPGQSAKPAGQRREKQVAQNASTKDHDLC
jgi:hypothetical protein